MTEFKASFLVGTDDYQIEAAQANDAIAEIPSRLNTQIEIWGLEGKESTAQAQGPRPHSLKGKGSTGSGPSGPRVPGHAAAT